MKSLSNVVDVMTPEEVMQSKDVNISTDDLFLLWKAAELLCKDRDSDD